MFMPNKTQIFKSITVKTGGQSSFVYLILHIKIVQQLLGHSGYQ